MIQLDYSNDSKVWSLATQHLLYAFPAEHSRSSFFRSMGQGNGVNQVRLYQGFIVFLIFERLMFFFFYR